MSNLFSRVRNGGEGRKELKEKTSVTFRITIPPTLNPQTVHVVGSWDKFKSAYPLEHDVKVGRGVWKGMLSEKAGLEMGTEHTYYFLLNSKETMPDPGSPAEEVVVDTKGRLLSRLYVPIELPPTPLYRRSRKSMHIDISEATPWDNSQTTTPTPGSVKKSVYLDFDNLGTEINGGPSEEPKRPHALCEAPDNEINVTKGRASLRERLRQRSSRHSLSSIFTRQDTRQEHSTLEDAGQKKKWGFSFKNRSTSRGEDLPRLSSEVNMSPASKENIRPQPDSLGRRNMQQESPNRAEIAEYLRHSVSGPEVPMNQAHDNSPVADTTCSPVEAREIKSVLPRNISDASKCSAATKDSVVTSPSLSYSVETETSWKDARSSLETPSDRESFTTLVHHSPGTNSNRDAEENNACEISATPDVHDGGLSTSGAHQSCVFPKFYNFDELLDVTHHNQYIGQCPNGNPELSGITIKPLGCLREEVAAEMVWRDEVVTELGYLGSIVV